jgi:N4-gp56 family major capsid protein
MNITFNCFDYSRRGMVERMLQRQKEHAFIMPVVMGRSLRFRFIDTSLLSANALTQEHWPQTVFEIMLDNMQLSDLMGESNDNVIVINRDLTKKAGDKVTFELDMPLESAGGTDDSDIEGNEEAMSFFNFPVEVHERSHGVKSAGKMTDKRTAIDIRKKAAYAIGRWAGEQAENDMIWGLSGLGNQNTYVGEATSSILTVNEKAPSSTRIFRGGQTAAGVVTEETTDSALADAAGTDYQNFLFGTKIISLIKTRAQLAYPKFKPVMVGGKWYYVMLIHPLQTKALREETGAAGWTQIQQSANIRGLANPLFTKEGKGRERMFSGIVGVYDDVILLESERIETRVAGEVFDNGDTIDAGVVSGTSRVARALLLGAQAGVWGWGQPWKRYEKNFDYNRKPGTATDAIYGFSKTRFRDPGASQSTNTAQADFAVWVVDTCCEEA